MEPAKPEKEGHHHHHHAPPADATACELRRDALVAFLDGPAMFKVNIANIIIIIVDGAFFFFLLVGWQAMCTPVMDCQPRNWWYNWSIQLLNVCFTYGALVALPWRLACFAHLFGGARSNEDGRDFYGRPTEETWFHIPLFHRRAINLVFLSNCFFQFANQGTRIYYPTYAAADEFPANLWTNLFFILAFLAAGVGAGYLARRETLLRREQPDRWNDPLADGVDAAKKWWRGEQLEKAASKAMLRLASTNGFEMTRSASSLGSAGSRV
mmetsp:Transcript_8117/g.25401  ORF Transcript_8117/g.25401 Transcript_8117/m.25401 type:complete len:268 (-) Transcript_8117:23-826(-)